MSGRPKKTRNIAFAPTVLGFKPYGESKSIKKKEPVFLYFEEYEALRLCDYEKRTQQQAAILINISRPTLTRIYSSAREKIAQAFVEGRQIIVEGGKVYLDKEWYTCKSCGCYFTHPYKDQRTLHKCPLCKSIQLKNCEGENYTPEDSDLHKNMELSPLNIAITSCGGEMDSCLDNHFGRCSHFVILNSQTQKTEFVKNPYKNQDKKTGILAVKLMEELQVKKVISGDFGLKVKPLLTDLEIQMIMIKETELTIQKLVQLLTYKSKSL